MDEKAFLEAMDKGFTNVGSRLESQIAEFNETAKKYLVKPEDVLSKDELDKTSEKAKMEAAGVLGGITEMEVWDIPVGQALLGGFVAVFASELIDGFLIKQGDWAKGLIKLAGAGAAVKWGGRFLGSTGSKAVALLLAYDGIRSLLPIDGWAKKGADTITSKVPAGGLGGFKKNAGEMNHGNNGRSEDYYADLKGGLR
jgi:hypothetical protein